MCKEGLEEALEGIEQALEVVRGFKENRRHSSQYVPLYMIWEAKENAYEEIGNLVAMLAKKPQPYKTEWKWE